MLSVAHMAFWVLVSIGQAEPAPTNGEIVAETDQSTADAAEPVSATAQPPGKDEGAEVPPEAQGIPPAADETVERTSETDATSESEEELDFDEPEWPLAGRLTDGIKPWKELRDWIQDQGISFNVAATQYFQFNGGGLNTEDSAGYSLSVDVDLTVDFGTLLKSEALDGLTFYIYMDYGHAENERVNGNVGSYFLPNWDAGDYGPVVAEYWFQYVKALDKLTAQIRLGKIDYSRTFDANAYANSEVNHFLNSAFANNPFINSATNNELTIGFGLDLLLEYQLTEKIAPYVAAGIYGADVPYGNWGFKETFDGRAKDFDTVPTGNTFDEADVLFVGEFGAKTALLNHGNGDMPGAYRIGFLYTSQEVNIYEYDTFGLRFPFKEEKGYNAFYLSFNQQIYKENADDDQGLGLFFRYAKGNETHNLPAPRLQLANDGGFLSVGQPITDFYSFGLNYLGLIPGRDLDTLAFGYAIAAYNQFGNENVNNPFGLSSGLGRYDEQVLELYYKIHVTDWLQITPDLQYILHPSGNVNTDDAVVAGIRVQLTF